MNSKLLALVMLTLVSGAGLGYSISLPQTMTLQSSVSQLESETSALKNDYDDLNITYNQLRDGYDSLNATYYELTSELSTLIADYNSLNESYVELSQQYEDLLFHYNLLNGPASSFTTVEDLYFELNLHRTVYYYKDPIAGNVTITYLNGTAFQGTFSITLRTSGASTGLGTFSINGFADFTANPPVFKMGPGNYTVSLSWIKTLDGYYIVTGSVPGTEIQVEVK